MSRHPQKTTRSWSFLSSPVRTLVAFVSWLIRPEIIPAGERLPRVEKRGKPGIAMRRLLAPERLAEVIAPPAHDEDLHPSFWHWLIASEQPPTATPGDAAPAASRSFLHWLVAPEKLRRSPERMENEHETG